MKRNIYLLAFLLGLTCTVNSQFVTKPLNFPGDDYLATAFSILDDNHCWVGVYRQSATPGVYLPYPYAVHTNDGGNTWQFDSIPMQGTPIIGDVSATDNNTAWYCISNAYALWSIWKTVNGGSTWQKMTTYQFADGYLNFYEPFSADTGLAVGDPNTGNFEFQLTTDGGLNWTRTPNSAIPSILPNEVCTGSLARCRIGNTIWFGTNKGRYFRSDDQGLTWTVKTVGQPSYGADIKFSDMQKGVFYDIESGNTIYKTTDGGDNWTPDTLATDGVVVLCTPVAGFDGGYVFTTTSDYVHVDVFFTPDFFNTVIQVDANKATYGYMEFRDASTGWMCGAGYANNDVYEYSSVLTSIKEAAQTTGKMVIAPNPTTTKALLKLHAVDAGSDMQLMICSMTGLLLETIPVDGNSVWTEIDATSYGNGVYLVKLVSGASVVSQTKWIVKH